jgi:transcriptional regulator with XRE-family HTH domain
MNSNQKFGTRLRELRKRAGPSLRELAANVNIDFTYLSKIENGVLPPPSEKVILHLAESLGADKDDLLTLAGRIPPDIAEILKNRDTIKRLRAERAKKEAKAMNQKVASLGITFFRVLRYVPGHRKEMLEHIPPKGLVEKCIPEIKKVAKEYNTDIRPFTGSRHLEDGLNSGFRLHDIQLRCPDAIPTQGDIVKHSLIQTLKEIIKYLNLFTNSGCGR